MRTSLIAIVVLCILIAGCVSPNQSEQTNHTLTTTAPPTTREIPDSTSAVPSIPPSVSVTSLQSPPGKTEYLSAVTGFLENVSSEINSIEKARSSNDYATVKNSADEISSLLALEHTFSYRGEDPYLIKIDAMFPDYLLNLQIAANHYYTAGNKGTWNDTATYSQEMAVGDAYYRQAKVTAQKIILELKHQNVTISENIQDANGIWFRTSVVYT